MAGSREITLGRFAPWLWGLTKITFGHVISTPTNQRGAAQSYPTSAFRAVLKEYTRERVPLDWAMTQYNLGTVLSSLGARENSTARLEEAVTAFRAALMEGTRERMPLQWAATQNNLGNVLMGLGKRESGDEVAPSKANAHLTLPVRGSPIEAG
jgi:hypothetical protein